MRTTTKNYFIALLMLSSFSGFSQTTLSEEVFYSSTRIKTIDFRSKELVGSSYLDENFLPAKFSNLETVYSLRYNAHQDEMEFENQGMRYNLPKRFTYTITFLGNNKVYQVYNFEDDDKTLQGFFVVLHKGDKMSLLLKEKIKLYDEVKAKSGYDKYQPPTLKRVKDKLFVGYKDSLATVLNKKKNILKLFSSSAKDVENYANQNKLSFKKNEDLIQIFKYFESL